MRPECPRGGRRDAGHPTRGYIQERIDLAAQHHFAQQRQELFDRSAAAPHKAGGVGEPLVARIRASPYQPFGLILTDDFRVGVASQFLGIRDRNRRDADLDDARCHADDFRSEAAVWQSSVLPEKRYPGQGIGSPESNLPKRS